MLFIYIEYANNHMDNGYYIESLRDCYMKRPLGTDIMFILKHPFLRKYKWHSPIQQSTTAVSQSYKQENISLIYFPKGICEMSLPENAL